MRIDTLETYTDPSGLFSISVPTGWNLYDQSTDATKLILWTDEFENALIIVAISESQPALSQEELTERLTAFVETFEDEDDFAMDPPQNLQSGGVQIVWSYTAQAPGGISAPLLANSFIYQDGDKLSVLTFGVPEEQFDRLRDSLDEMLHSYIVDPSVSLAPGDFERVSYDFSDESGGWATVDDEGVRAEIADGVYTIIIKAPDSYYLSAPDFVPTGDMAVTANVLIQGDSRAGLALRLSRADDGTRSYYACWIDGGDRYGCFVSVNNQWTTLQEPISDAAIIPGAVNKVNFTAVGDVITFSVNDAEVARFTDSRVAEGVPALYLENFATEAGAVFDDVTIVTPLP
nr:MAG: hypothetical protein DIU80_23580 [Chloroflexota bacterium]